MADPNSTNNNCVDTVPLKISYEKNFDLQNEEFNLCFNMSVDGSTTAPVCVNIWPEICQIIECKELEKCPIQAGTIEYSAGPGVTPDNSAGFVRANKDGVQVITEYCVLNGPSGRSEIWTIERENGANSAWQWHQST